MPTTDNEVTLTYRMVSASVASVLTSLFATPLDVIKIRMQVQISELCGANECDICNPNLKNIKKSNIPQHWTYKSTLNGKQFSIPISNLNNKYYVFHNGLEETYLRTSLLKDVVNQSKCKNMEFKNSIDAFYKILKNEGISSLYTGLNISLIMSIPRVIIYYSLYDSIKNIVINYYRSIFDNYKYGNIEYLLPPLCGMGARIVSVNIVAPMELVRTQMMARTIDRNLSWIQATRLNISKDGILSLWKGVVPTLWRDVPFSGIYWMGYEFFKDYFILKYDNNNNENTIFKQWNIAFKSGALSGIIATLITQPFDTIKTLKQSEIIGNSKINNNDINLKPIRTIYDNINNVNGNGNNNNANKNIKKNVNWIDIGKRIVKREGINGLFTGLSPRMARVPLSCAVMVSSYEIGKIFLSNNK